MSLSFTKLRISYIAFALISIVLCVDMLAGPIRFYLSHAGLEFLVYLPKVLAFIFILFEIVRKRLRYGDLYTLLILLFFSGIGLLNHVGIAPQLFDLFLMTPFLLGIVATSNFDAVEDNFVKLMVLIFVITVMGIYIDAFIDFPWKGFVYNVGGADIEGSRDWTAMGFERIAGFARLSSAAAFYVVCSGLFLCAYSNKLAVRSVIVVVAVSGVFLTTNKAGIGGLVLGILSIVLARFKKFTRIAIYLLAVMVIVLPLTAIVHRYKLNLNDPINLLLFASFEDRLTNTWPNFFLTVAKLGNPITGVGFGGVGSSTQYFSHGGQTTLAFADNFALYLYGCFGVAAVGLFLYLAHVATTLFSSQRRLDRSLAPVMVAILAASITTDIIEAQVFAVMTGLSVASIWCRKAVIPTLEES